jgi:hypothetical protein
MVQVPRTTGGGKDGGVVRPLVAGGRRAVAVHHFPRVFTVAVPTYFEGFLLGVAPVIVSCSQVDRIT